MHVELSEVLTCPECRSPQGLVVLVGDLDGEGRLRRGELGCSRCERRYPVRGGVVDLAAGGDAADGEERAGAGEPRELAAEVGGLLGLPDLRGPVILGPGLLPAAPLLAELAEGARLLAFRAPGGEGADAGSGEEPGSVVTVVRAPGGRLPLMPGKAAGVALWRPGEAAVADAVRALRPGARLAALRPAGEIRSVLAESDLEVLASEERAVVARRRG